MGSYAICRVLENDVQNCCCCWQWVKQKKPSLTLKYQAEVPGLGRILSNFRILLSPSWWQTQQAVPVLTGSQRWRNAFSSALEKKGFHANIQV